MSCCPVCLGECHEENARIRSLIVAYVKARRERETFLHSHLLPNENSVKFLLAEDAAWAALVEEADRT